MRELLESPDLFGQVERRIAYLLAEEQPPDGGKSLLGEDLRDRLWNAILKAANTYQPAMDSLVEAFLELDPTDYCGRVTKYLPQASAALEINLRRSLRRLPPGTNTGDLVADLFCEDETVSSLALYAYSSASISQVEQIREVMRCQDTPLGNRKRAVDFLLHGNDPEVDRDLVKLLDLGGSEEWPIEIRGALGQIETVVAIEALRRDLERLLESPAENQRLIEEDEKALTNNPHPLARRWLEKQLVSSDFDNSQLARLIGGYAHQPIHDAMSAWLWDVFQHSHLKENRLSALCALRDSTWREAARHVQTVIGPAKNEFRLEAISLLERFGGLEAARHVFEVADRNDCEDPAELILSATRIAHLRRSTDNSAMLLQVAAPRVQDLMVHGNPDEMQRATKEAWRFGPSSLLVEILRTSSIPEVRRAAVVALGKLGPQASDVLDDLIALVPKWTPHDTWESQAGQVADPALIPIVVKAVINIDPTRLLGISNPICESALRRFSYDTGCWVFKDRILDPRGQRLQSWSIVRQAISNDVSAKKTKKLLQYRALFLVASKQSGGTWYVYNLHSGRWRQGKPLNGLRRGNQHSFLMAFAAGEGFLSRDAAIRLLTRGTIPPGTDYKKKSKNANAEISKLRTLIRQQFDLDETVDPLPWNDAGESPGWRAELEIRVPEMDDDGKPVL